MQTKATSRFPEPKLLDPKSLLKFTHKEYPLTAQQNSLWLNYLADPANSSLNVAFNFKILGRLNVKKFVQANLYTYKHVEACRTIFIEDPKTDKVKQIILKKKFLKHIELEYILEYIDLVKENEGNGKSEEEIYEEALEINRVRVQKIINLRKFPINKGHLIHYDKNKFLYGYVSHHILFDSFSAAVSFKIIEQYYNDKLKAKQGLLLLKISRQMKDVGDYIKFYEEKINRKSLNLRHQKYWKEAVKSSKFQFEFDKLSMRHSIADKKIGERVFFSLSKEYYEKLMKFIKLNKATLFLTLSTIFNICLYRYFDSKDIVVGYPTSVRRKKFRFLFSFLVNNLPLRVKIFKENLTFIELLRTISEKRLHDREHKEYDIKKIINENKKTNFNVTINATTFGFKGMKLKGVKAHPFYEGYGTVQVDLALLYDSNFDNELYFAFEFRKAIFRKKFIVEMAKHFINILQDAVDNPTRQILKIKMLSDGEVSEQVKTFNETEKITHDHKITILEIYDKYYKPEYDNFIAVVDQDDKKYTFKDFNQKVDNCVSHFRKVIKIGDHKIVGIYFNRTIECLVSMFAIMRIGLAFCYIDPKNPRDRITYIVDKAKIDYIVTQKKYNLNVAKGIKVVEYDDTTPGKKEKPIYPQLKDLCYVIFTSGSTGKPKGILLEHIGLSNLVLTQNKLFKIDKQSKVIQFASLNFDASISEIFTTFLTYSTLYVINNSIRYSPLELFQYLKRNEITHATIPPVIAEIMNKKPRELSLKCLVVAGSVTKLEAMNTWSEYLNKKGEKLCLLNAYGPSENTVCATVHEFKKGDHNQNIGLSMDNVKIFIIDSHHNLLPIGVKGEIIIAGRSLMRGYLNDELNKAKFITFHGNRCYKTGDAGRYCDYKGSIKFIGRIDNQVKIAGYRIELNDIQSVLNLHNKVKQSIITVVEVNEQKKLLAYVVPEEKDHAKDEKQYVHDLKEYLKKKLMIYMVPNYFIVIGDIPLTPNGKVDKIKLPKLKQAAMSMGENFEKLGDKEKIIYIVKELLLLDELKDDENLFDLGGDSMSLISLNNKLNEMFEISLPFKILFHSPTIKTIYQYIETHKAKGERGGMRNPVVVLRKFSPKSDGKEQPPMFIIHDGFGILSNRATSIVPFITDRSLYAIDDPFFFDPTHKWGTIDAMAKFYKKHILLNMKKHKSVILGGVCAGGLVALKISEMFLEENKDIEIRIVLLNTYNLRKYKKFLRVENSYVDFLVKYKIQSQVAKTYFVNNSSIYSTFEPKKFKIGEIKDIILIKSSFEDGKLEEFDVFNKWKDNFEQQIKVYWTVGSQYNLLDFKNVKDACGKNLHMAVKDDYVFDKQLTKDENLVFFAIKNEDFRLLEITKKILNMKLSNLKNDKGQTPIQFAKSIGTKDKKVLKILH